MIAGSQVLDLTQHMTFLDFFGLLFVCTLFSYHFVHSCEVNLPVIDLEPSQYNGSWFVVARKAAESCTFAPVNISSSLVRLQIEGDQLNLTEYHTLNEVCMPPLSGIWTKTAEGYKMEGRTENGQLFTMDFRAIYHEYSGENNEEMNMVLYGCSEKQANGYCKPGEESLLIMSNSRHPQTLQLFKSAKLIEDSVCIDILQFNILETYTACGDEIVDEDQKLIHATIDENNEFVDVECKVANFRPEPNNIAKFFDDPRVLTIIAYIDPTLSNEQIAHVSCNYQSKSRATCEWIRQNKCFKTELNQSIDKRFHLTISSNFTSVTGNTTEIDWSGDVIWENGDEYISMHCLLVDDDGGCDSYRIYVWSDEDHMDQPTMNEIYRQLQAVCVDPTDLVFLNTFHECVDEPSEQLDAQCGVGQMPRFPLNSAILQGVWYFAADLNADPKIFLQSAVINLVPNETDSNLLHLTYYAQKEADGECVGPGEGTARLENDTVLAITVEYRYTLVPKFKNTLKFNYEVLYIDNQRAVLYWCFRRDANGTCLQHDVNLMIRSRHFSRNDLNMVLPYLDNVCIDKDDLRWFDLHSQCGTEMSASTKLRRDLVTLSHYDVLHILCHVQEPRCLYHEIQGVQVDLGSLEKAGTWYLTSRYDELAMDTYAMVGRVFAVSNTTAVLRLSKAAALPGETLACYTHVFTIKEENNGTDYFYELHFESTTKNTTTLIFRFLFYNRHVGVLYSCLSHKPDGRCDEKAVYVISRHESIDHAELIVLETIAKTVCVEPNVLYHTAVHDECVFDTSLLKPAACSTVDESSASADWRQLTHEEIVESYGSLTYHAVASSRMYANPFALKYDGASFQKITDEKSGCLSVPVSVRFSARNRLLVQIDEEVVLLHPAAVRDEVLLKEAQQAGDLPCLHSLEINNVTCSQLAVPDCKPGAPIQKAEELLGDWVLYASEPTYVLNMKCTVTEGEGDKHNFACLSESWYGECERETEFELSTDAWGGFQLTATGNSAPLRTSSELFANGNITVTAERIIFMRDEVLVGRRYSIWLRPGAPFSQQLESDAAQYCVWPLAPQIRTTDLQC